MNDYKSKYFPIIKKSFELISFKSPKVNNIEYILKKIKEFKSSNIEKLRKEIKNAN